MADTSLPIHRVLTRTPRVARGHSPGQQWVQQTSPASLEASSARRLRAGTPEEAPDAGRAKAGDGRLRPGGRPADRSQGEGHLRTRGMGYPFELVAEETVERYRTPKPLRSMMWQPAPMASRPLRRVRFLHET
jgi:hypothetical protein